MTRNQTISAIASRTLSRPKILFFAIFYACLSITLWCLTVGSEFGLPLPTIPYLKLLFILHPFVLFADFYFRLVWFPVSKSMNSEGLKPEGRFDPHPMDSHNKIGLILLLGGLHAACATLLLFAENEFRDMRMFPAFYSGTLVLVPIGFYEFGPNLLRRKD